MNATSGKRWAIVVGTCDTKAEDLDYVRGVVQAAGVPVRLVDVGTKSGDTGADVSAAAVAACHPEGAAAVSRSDDRGQAIAAMATAFEGWVERNKDDILGMIGIGGSGNTALITPGMGRLPIGVPKIMVSTVASGNVAPYVGPNDIAMMYSVVDVAGINAISRQVLGNAANMLAGAVLRPIPAAAGTDKPAIGLTMFGVTTPCVHRVVDLLKGEYECFVFHATGAGGRTMEKLADSGRLVGLIDTTTTEVADLFMGGVMSAGEDRLGAAIRTRLPYVGSCGALDMVNFGGLDTVPEKYRGRKLHVHNAQVTLMRTTPEENRRMGEWIGAKLNQMEGPVRFLIPERGFSMIDVAGGPFHDPEADAALIDALERTVVQTAQRRLIRLPLAMNDPPFADALVENFREIVRR
ncbi:MAG: Tm-1-like ATP-binding domain-containing protein [Rhodovulum sp.]|nr:Tm-1-like ATP-binding domain-containing protein [Rhodovulum sp.]